MTALDSAPGDTGLDSIALDVAALVVPRLVLDEARLHMEAAGAAGVEATGFVVAGPDRVARHVIFPDQRAGLVDTDSAPFARAPGRNPYRSRACWVEVSDRGKAELALALGPAETYAARIHSHPGGAFHSAADNRNPALCYEGALSIVVPFFGLGLRAGLNVCAVYMRRARRWHDLRPGLERDEVIRVAV